MTYEELLKLSDTENLIVKEKNIPGYGGRIYKNRIAIHQGIDTSVEKACVLAEELGHHYTSVGCILDQTDLANRKQERQARLWDVTEEYLQECINCYQSKYGICTTVDNYVIYFVPYLTVTEMI